MLQEASACNFRDVLVVTRCEFLGLPQCSWLGLALFAAVTSRYNSSLLEVNGGFDEMVAGTPRYYVVGGKGGVGKTSVAASLAVKFASLGESTLIASTDPGHSLGDSFEQDLSDRKIVPVNGVVSLSAVEVGHVKRKEEPYSDGSWICDLQSRIGLGFCADPNKLNEILSKFPTGFKEVFSIAQLIKFVELQEGKKFRRIVLDTAATGHTLNLLSANDCMEKLLGVAIKVVNAASSHPDLKSTFGKHQIDPAMLEELRQQIARAHEIFHNPQSTEFIIVTIPTVMAISESSRFHASLKKDGVPARKLIVNQVLPQSASDCRFCTAKRKEEAHALNMISEDRELAGLKLIQAPLIDVEVRGVPALRFFSDAVWK